MALCTRDIDAVLIGCSGVFDWDLNAEAGFDNAGFQLGTVFSS